MPQGYFPRKPATERFWAKVDKTETCWLWTGAKNSDGYGYLLNAGKQVRVHRQAYEWLVGPIPQGLTIDHLCRVRHCVNPAHLEPVTSKVNTMRGDTPAARNAAKIYCKRGHILSEENVSRNDRGWRTCRTCRNTRAWRFEVSA